LTGPGASSVYGQNVTFTLAVGPSLSGTPTGAVTFMDGTTTLGTVAVSGGQASFMSNTLASGVHSITAVYSGDANFNPHTSAALVQTVTPAPTTTTLNSSSN